MLRVLILTACFSAALAVSAHAHPGSKILTTGNGERTAMSGAVAFEETNGVHLFRGGSPAEKHELLGGETRAPSITHDRSLTIIINMRPFRSIRRLRTQGFYSGVPYPSRGYTQGFYSTGR